MNDLTQVVHDLQDILTERRDENIRLRKQLADAHDRTERWRKIACSLLIAANTKDVQTKMNAFDAFADEMKKNV